jgi:hypothetical protein
MNLRLPVIAAVDVVVLTWAKPDFATLRSAAAAPASWIATHGTDEAASTLATTLLWATAAWLAIGITAATLAALPGTTGRAATTLARLVLPRAALQFVCGAAGVGLVLSPTAALADSGHLPAPLPPTSSASQTSSSTSALPPPSWPTTRRQLATAAGEPAVVVKPGDSLWSIARAHLPQGATDAQVGAAWPSWYRTNRRTIGRDPALLHAGERLTPPNNEPGATNAGTSTDDAR